MKTICSFFLSFFLLLIFSCENETLDNTDLLTKKYEESITDTAARIRSSTSIEDKLDILRLGTIELMSNAQIKSIIYTSASDDETDEHITYVHLKSQAALIGLDLIELMQQSLLLHGGTTTQSSEIPSLINCFDLGGTETYCPFIHIPFASEFSFQSIDPLLATSGSIAPADEIWYGKDYFAGTGVATIQLNKTIAISRPVWNITITDGIDLGESSDPDGGIMKGWLPWRRCYCERAHPNENGDIITGGSCNQFRSSGNRCNFSCGRSSFKGICDEGFCEPC